MSLIYTSKCIVINYLVSYKSKCNTIKQFIIISLKIITAVVWIKSKNLYAHITVVKRLSKNDDKMLIFIFFQLLALFANVIYT